VCGGLIVSQLVTLLITPVIYTYFDELQNWLGRKSHGPEPDAPDSGAQA
jgi:HAE1 family hydrophobic/amphiphilic exporter-1